MLGYIGFIGLFGGWSSGNGDIVGNLGLDMGGGLYLYRTFTLQLSLSPSLRFPTEACVEDYIRVKSSVFIMRHRHEIGVQASFSCYKEVGERTVNRGSYKEIYSYTTGGVGKRIGLYYNLRYSKGEGRVYLGFGYWIPIERTCVPFYDGCKDKPYVSFPSAEFSLGYQVGAVKIF